MSSASRMASFINQKSTCSHLDPYALILRQAADIGILGMELSVWSWQSPEMLAKLLICACKVLEPIKDRSSLAEFSQFTHFSIPDFPKHSSHPYPQQLQASTLVGADFDGMAYLWRDASGGRDLEV